MNPRGFTLPELVAVIVILSVLAAYATPRLFDRRTFDARGFSAELATAARYARQHAISSGCAVRMSVTPSGYTLSRPATFCDTSAFPGSVLKPGGGDFAAAAPDGTAIGGAPATITFQASGATDLAADLTLTVGAHAVRIERATGFVQTP